MRAAANGSTAPCAYRECSAGEFAQLRNSGNAPVLATSERTSASQPTETGKQLRNVVRSSIFYILLHGGYRPIDLVTAAMGGRRSKSATVADARSPCPFATQIISVILARHALAPLPSSFAASSPPSLSSSDRADEYP